MKTKTFDCVAMKRAGARRVQEKLKGMDIEEQLAFWDKRTQKLVARQKKNAGGGATS